MTLHRIGPTSALGIALCLGLAMTGPASAVSMTFSVQLDGFQEVGGGDTTGHGSGTITFDPDADMISWMIDYADLTDDTIHPFSLSGWHIHGPGGPAGTSAAILVNLDNLGGLGVPSGTLSGAIAADSANIDTILADPSDFYLNLHTDDGFGGFYGSFPGGAIRGQIPEPSTLLLTALGLAGLTTIPRRLRDS